MKPITSAIRTGSTRRRVPTSAIIAALVMVVVAAAPLLGASVYAVTVLTSLLAYALLAMSIQLAAGHAGLLTLAHAGYAGVGAYAAVLTARHLSADAFVQLLVAVVVAALIAAMTGWIVLRASKTYFLMLSLAIGELLYLAALQWREVTRGSDGLSAGKPLEIAGQPVVLAGYVFWVVVPVFLVFAGVVLVVVYSPFGASLRGIRDNEQRMRSLGYPTARYKYAAWVFSGAIAGAAGWIFVAQLPRFVDPGLLSFRVAGFMLLAVVIGGLGSMWGACVGAVVVGLLSDVGSQFAGGRGPLIMGVLFVIAVYVLPRGLAGIRLRRTKRSGGPNLESSEVLT
jgi:branched-chain amino acid transport system permease protein